MKILHLLCTNKFSGAENVVSEIISMADKDYKMIYVSPDGPIRRSLKERNVPYLNIERFNIVSIRKAIKVYKPDIIHAHDIRASIFAALSTFKIPIVSHIHCNFNTMRKLSIKSVTYRLFLHRFNRVFAVSSSTLEEYRFKNALKKRCIVLENVINKNQLVQFVNNDKCNYDFDYVFIGRLTDQKDPKRIISITSKVKEKIPKVKVGIIGDGELKNDIAQLINKKRLTDNIILCGYLNNPYRVLKQSKLLLMCSKYEGLPMTALEAMLLGTPVVSTPVDGLKTIIKNGYSGFLEHDDNCIADRIINLLKERDKRMYISENARKTIEKSNNIENYWSTLKNVYDNLSRNQR